MQQDNMKIALLTDGIYPFVIGGMQRHSYFIAKYLSQRKVFVRVYHCIHNENESDDYQKLKQIFTEDEWRYLEFIKIPFEFSSKFPGYYIIESYRYSKRIYDHLIQDIEKFDFIYSKGFTAWYLLKNKKNNFPEIGVKLHGYEMYQYAPDFKTKLQHFLLKIPANFVTQNADVVFSYGGKITNILREKLKIDSKKIIEIPAGIEKKLIKQRVTEYHSPLSFVFVGRHEKRKGIEHLNKSLLELLDESIDFKFHFIGDIPKHLQIKNNQIIYHGKIIDYEKIAEILSVCDVLVCPSYSEGMPNVIIEAMANGLTVIATDVGAVKLMVNDDTGYLINNNGVNTLKEILIQVIGEKKAMLQFKKEAALRHIENFFWEKIAERLLNEIKKFLLQR